MNTLNNIDYVECIKEKLTNIRLSRKYRVLQCLSDTTLKKGMVYKLHESTEAEEIGFGKHFYVIGEHNDEIVRVYLEKDTKYSMYDATFEKHFKIIE